MEVNASSASVPQSLAQSHNGVSGLFRNELDLVWAVRLEQIRSPPSANDRFHRSLVLSQVLAELEKNVLERDGAWRSWRSARGQGGQCLKDNGGRGELDTKRAEEDGSLTR